jgi:uncharacterized membrane-anchored protein
MSGGDHGRASRPPLPADHPLRGALNDEVHARPPEALRSPVRVTYLALLRDAQHADGETRALAALLAPAGVAPPAPDENHLRADLGDLRLRWERHTEFSRYLFAADGADPHAPFADLALDDALAARVAALPGVLLVATRLVVLPGPLEPADPEALAERFFAGHPLVGGAIAGGAGRAYTDFRIHADGFGRVLIHDLGMTPRQTGRMAQRLLEIDTYRMLALLALPAARALAPRLAEVERELAAVTHALSAASPQDEPELLDRLTRLEAEVERHEADHQSRFAAAAAYHDLVQRRIAELREGGQPGLQSFREFTERRLVPAMATCRAASARLDALSERIVRASQLLSTRIEMTRERQNQQLLESMNERAELSLHLQSTVEGLSVAAVTYYVVGLVSYAAKGLADLGLRVSPGVVTALSIPVVAGLVALGVRRIRRIVHRRRA